MANSSILKKLVSSGQAKRKKTTFTRTIFECAEIGEKYALQINANASPSYAKNVGVFPGSKNPSKAMSSSNAILINTFAKGSIELLDRRKRLKSQSSRPFKIFSPRINDSCDR